VSRGRKWAVAAGILGLLLLVAFIIVSKLGSLSPIENPGLKLQFAGFTNINRQWYAQMVLTNQSGQMHFVNAWSSTPKYHGEAVSPTATNELRGLGFSGVPTDVAAQKDRSFLVEFPKRTESWQIAVYCYRSDPFSRSLVEWSHWFSGWPDWLTKPTVRVFLQPTWDRGFAVSSGILTNRPPKP
jgi:hypothetical protein